MSDSAFFWGLMAFGLICFVLGMETGKEQERQKHE